MSRTAKLLFLAVVLLQAIFFFYISQHRLIDGDEGFYLLASRLVLQHKAPYLDFFYTQAPLLPYVYGAWLKVFGISWFSGRTFSALLTTILGALIYKHVCDETGRWQAAVVASILFASSALIFAWFAIVKTFALAILFLFTAYIIVSRLAATTPKWLLLVAGILTGLSVDTRSYVIVIAPVLLWWIIRRTRPAPVIPAILYCAGGTIGLVPSLLLFFASPDAFLFNNLGYHALRSGEGLVAGWKNKLEVASGLFAGGHTGIQFSLLTLACCWLVFTRRMKRDSAVLAFVIALVLGVVSLLPTPSEVQYFAMIVPFLIVAAVCSIRDSVHSLSNETQLRRARTVGAVAMVVFVVASVPTLDRYLITGHKVPGLMGPADTPNWTLQRVSDVSAVIDQLATPGEEVASFWPGYIFASHADPYPGFENDFGMYVAARLPNDKREAYHILSPAQVEEDFAHHGPHLAVIGNQGPMSGGPENTASLTVARNYGYKLVRRIGGTRIFECCASY